MATEPKYTTVLEFNKFLEMDSSIPNRKTSAGTARETVGSSDGSRTVYFLNNGFIIRNSETLLYGSTEATATATLTRDTDYTIDYDLGKITLSAAAAIVVTGTTLYSGYSWNKYDKKDSQLMQRLVRAVAEIDSMTNTLFVLGTAATPEWGVASDELHVGQGQWNKVYGSLKYPISSTTATLSGAVSAGATTITATSTNGFPTSGVITIDTNKVAYTGKTTDTFTGCSNVTAHATGVPITSFVLEIATDAEGNAPSWEVRKYNTQFSIDFDSGEFKINDESLDSTVFVNNYQPTSHVFDRIRLSYNYGNNTVPGDIRRAVHLIAGKEMFTAGVLNALARSTDGFDSDGITNVDRQIERIINKYKSWLVKDTKP